jgi:hypothetical protein
MALAGLPRDPFLLYPAATSPEWRLIPAWRGCWGRSKAYKATGTPRHERAGEYPLLVEEWRLMYPRIRVGEAA